MSTKVKLKAAGMLAALLLVVAIAITHGPGVKAAGNGKITGMVKLDGTAPHMKGIDMSKDPYCSKAHESSPAALELVVVGKNNGLENVVLYISQGCRTARAQGFSPAGIRSARLHVFAPCHRNEPQAKSTRSPTAIRPHTIFTLSRIP